MRPVWGLGGYIWVGIVVTGRGWVLIWLLMVGGITWCCGDIGYDGIAKFGWYWGTCA